MPVLDCEVVAFYICPHDAGSAALSRLTGSELMQVSVRSQILCDFCNPTMVDIWFYIQ
jgi:hypothetical protein